MDVWGSFSVRGQSGLAQADQRWCAVSSLGILTWLDKALCSMTSPQGWLSWEQEVGPETPWCSFQLEWSCDPVNAQCCLECVRVKQQKQAWLGHWLLKCTPNYNSVPTHMHPLQNLFLFFIDKDPNPLSPLLGKETKGGLDSIFWWLLLCLVFLLSSLFQSLDLLTLESFCFFTVL